MKDFEKILNEDIPSPEVQDERISYGSIDASAYKVSIHYGLLTTNLFFLQW